MKQVLTTLAAALLLALPAAGKAEARPPLSSVTVIDDGLYQIALANLVRRRCDAIEGRVLKAVGILRELNRHARSLGYTQAEIDAYVDNDAEKDRMKARAAAMFAARGIDPDKPEDLCRYGLEEIASNSPVGALLKAK